MTLNRLRQYEQLLRRLRMYVFDDPRIEQRNLIGKVKQHCMADWRERHQRIQEDRMRFYYL